jgi:hypothetical protein
MWDLDSRLGDCRITVIKDFFFKSILEDKRKKIQDGPSA